MAITGAFGNLSYLDNGTIVLPITFTESGVAVDVFSFDKSNLSLTRMAGSDAAELNYFLQNKIVSDVLQNDEYEAVFIPKLGTVGAVLADLTGEVVLESSSQRQSINVDPLLISYNNLIVALADLETPYKTSDGYWNVGIEFEFPVLGFSVDYLIIGIDYNVPVLYQSAMLDVKPDTPPPAYDINYDQAGSQNIHCVGDWNYLADSANTQQGKFFWAKFQSDSVQVPEVLLGEGTSVLDNITPVSVAL